MTDLNFRGLAAEADLGLDGSADLDQTDRAGASDRSVSGGGYGSDTYGRGIGENVAETNRDTQTDTATGVDAGSNTVTGAGADASTNIGFNPSSSAVASAANGRGRRTSGEEGAVKLSGKPLAMRAPPTPMFPWEHASQSASEAAMARHVSDAAFPCVGAKAALAKGTLSVLACKAIDSAWDDVRIHDALSRFAADYRADPGLFRSLAVTFDGPAALSEDEFEAALWSRLQSLSDKDVWRGHGYDEKVSSDPSNPHFSLSFGGEAFFVVGLHPNASRPARRFVQPALVFNLHDQFELLRAEGRYETMREKILVRDEALAGSRNPMLARHGEVSEARQYSGRPVGEGWACPFAYRGAGGGDAERGEAQADEIQVGGLQTGGIRTGEFQAGEFQTGQLRVSAPRAGDTRAEDA
jgi:FPC/CPF motif-containing protein YcgG